MDEIKDGDLVAFCRRHFALFHDELPRCPMCDRGEPARILTPEQEAIADRVEAEARRQNERN